MFGTLNERFSRAAVKTDLEPPRVVSCKAQNNLIKVTVVNEYACRGPPPSVLQATRQSKNKPRDNTTTIRSHNSSNLNPTSVAFNRHFGRGRGIVERMGSPPYRGRQDAVRQSTSSRTIVDDHFGKFTASDHHAPSAVGDHRGFHPRGFRKSPMSSSYQRPSGKVGQWTTARNAQYRVAYSQGGTWPTRYDYSDVDELHSKPHGTTANYDLNGYHRSSKGFARENQYWQHDNRRPTYQRSDQKNNFYYPRYNDDFFDPNPTDEYIDDFSLEDLAKAKLEINLDPSKRPSQRCTRSSSSRWKTGPPNKPSSKQDVKKVVNPTDVFNHDSGLASESTTSSTHEPLDRPLSGYLESAFRTWAKSRLGLVPRPRCFSEVGHRPGSLVLPNKLHRNKSWPCLTHVSSFSEATSESGMDPNLETALPRQCRSFPDCSARFKDLPSVPSRFCRSVQDMQLCQLFDSGEKPIFSCHQTPPLI